MRLLVGFLLLSANLAGQDLIYIKDSSVVNTIAWLPSAEPFDTTRSFRKAEQKYIYIISDHDLYDLFGYNKTVDNRQFDFTNYHILGTQLCRQCLEYCSHNEGKTDCHRNICSYEWVWQMRDNKKAFTEIRSVTKDGHVGNKLPKGRLDFFGDTIIIGSTADRNHVQWYTHGRGDCHARFLYVVYLDKYYPVTLLKELNHWGGCRAGGNWAFTISFFLTRKVAQYSKNVVLMKNYRDKD